MTRSMRVRLPGPVLRLVLGLAVAGAFVGSAAIGADGGGQPPWSDAQGRFIMAITGDAQGMWVGCEGHGCWQSDQTASRWTPWAVPQELLNDSVLSLVVDRQGRTWAGLSRHGIVVLAQGGWHPIAGDAGPGGYHITALAVSPLDGAVWMASENGLVRYQDRGDWEEVGGEGTGETGGPPCGVRSLAFAADGRVYAATPAHGVWSALPAEHYRHWTVTRGQDPIPPIALGPGLPSDLVNAVLVAGDGTVWAATDLGLAWSHDGGTTWEHRCGQDWPALAKRPAPAEVALLAEDYCTCLHDAGAGKLWIGHRQAGVEILDVATGTLMPVVASGGSDFARVIASGAAGLRMIGTYGGGVVRASVTESAAPPALAAPVLSAPLAEADHRTPAVGQPPSAMIPAPAPPPDAAQLRAALRQVLALRPYPPRPPAPMALPLADDWRTRGDWLGRYGRYWACLAAIRSPRDCVWGAGGDAVRYAVMVGPRHRQVESQRYWIQWLHTDNPKVLEMPPLYLHQQVALGLNDWQHGRRESEWNDMGHSYPPSDLGPSLVCNVTIPGRTMVLSLYDYNKDGHDGSNRWRDYQVLLRRMPDGLDLTTPEGDQPWPLLASGRITDFWDGCYQRYLVRGPMTLSIAVERNHSFNTMLTAVMLDDCGEYPDPY